MIEGIKEGMADIVRDFHLPKYDELPNMGLYLEQVTKYINDCLSPLGNVSITYSMISNYVKRGLVDNPVKKLYYRDHIAYLIFIAVTKNVLSLDNISCLMDMQRETYENQVAYDYFCSELENIVAFVFGVKDTIDNVGSDATDERTMLRNTIITVAHRAYLDMCFRAMQDERE